MIAPTIGEPMLQYVINLREGFNKVTAQRHAEEVEYLNTRLYSSPIGGVVITVIGRAFLHRSIIPCYLSFTVLPSLR